MPETSIPWQAEAVEVKGLMWFTDGQSLESMALMGLDCGDWPYDGYG